MYRTIALVVLMVAIATLQVYLCKRENRRVGLILPAIFFILSILAVIGMHFYAGMPNLISVIYLAIQVFVLVNIPTAILMAIYIMYHGRRL
ncbi:MAG: hypothetical protein LBE57_07240 [Methanosarcinales archaeon]|jgi:hypothetical protein|nr:hypothetical protein [Methanosarcinales archaeon]